MAARIVRGLAWRVRAGGPGLGPLPFTLSALAHGPCGREPPATRPHGPVPGVVDP